MKKSFFNIKTILGNFVSINEENKSKEIQGKNVLSFTKFVLGEFCPGGLAWEFLSWEFLSGALCMGDFCPDTLKNCMVLHIFLFIRCSALSHIDTNILHTVKNINN